MMKFKRILLILILTLIYNSSFGQSHSKEELINNWISTSKIFETGDTIQYVKEEMTLKKDGSMIMKDRGMNLEGEWKYIEKNNQVELTLQIGDRSETIALELDKVTSDNLILTQRKGDKFMTKIYVKNFKE